MINTSGENTSFLMSGRFAAKFVEEVSLFHPGFQQWLADLALS
jgi:hypothetical protein